MELDFRQLHQSIYLVCGDYFHCLLQFNAGLGTMHGPLIMHVLPASVHRMVANTFQCTYLLTPRSKVFLEKRTGSKLFKKFYAFN